MELYGESKVAETVNIQNNSGNEKNSKRFCSY